MRRDVKKHGTNTSYHYGCRCDRCRFAHTTYVRELKAGRPRRVLGDAAREKLLTLRQAGFSEKEIADQTGIEQTMIWRIVHRRCRFVYRTTEARILAIDPRTLEHEDGAVIDGAEMWQKIDALIERGYSRWMLQRMLGYTLLYRRPPRVRACTAYRVSRLCDEIEAGRVRR